MQPSRDLAALIGIMAALRTPGTGCAWDLQQDFASIGPYTIEEAYEVVDAIERGDLEDLRDELGDLLLQVVFHAQMAREQGAFDFGGVVEAITAKLIRRHPHVFGDARDLAPAEVKALWGKIKAQEKAGRLARREAAGLPPAPQPGLLAAIPVTLPALTRALKLQQQAAAVGFDWNDPRQVIAKIKEETAEIEAALDAVEAGRGTQEDAVGEAGDLLFATVNLLRHLDADPERALRRTNDKFTRRFKSIEAALDASGKRFADVSLDDMEALWVKAKVAEQAPA